MKLFLFPDGEDRPFPRQRNALTGARRLEQLFDKADDMFVDQHSAHHRQQSGVQTLPSFPPLAQNNLYSNLKLKSQEGEVPAGHVTRRANISNKVSPVLPGTSTVFPLHYENMMKCLQGHRYRWLLPLM
ncbi:hypothetical protein DCAR_0520089 [Daucus carota subsp. sativus]|uniref:Uncharacterized protein n=1 Tax=Daucus carota subsp. sativus TaxID=79200 RepID=A0AAF0X3Z4_DAUCS|nr:hypothetical protein DCAR_0520089 [Daucus carota subsp. sativus]